jgi:hypothetical protein
VVRDLDVLLFAERVGTLTLVGGRLHFAYLPEWLGAQVRRRVHALAVRLPGAARELAVKQAGMFAGRPVIERIIALIELRSALTIRRLAHSGEG